MGSLRMVLLLLLLLLLDRTDNFKFEKFRNDKDSARFPRDFERIVIFLACLGTSFERPVRGDVAEEDNDPDRAAQFCVNMRSNSTRLDDAQPSVWGRFHDGGYPIHAQSVHQLETQRPEFCTLLNSDRQLQRQNRLVLLRGLVNP